MKKITLYIILVLIFIFTTKIYGTQIIDNNLDQNLNLSRIYVSKGKLEPEFSSSRTYYTLNLNKEDTDLFIQVSPENSSANYEITGDKKLKEGENLITITVSSPLSDDKKTYTINALLTDDKDGYNALLSNIIIDNFSFTEDFFPEVFSYTTTGATDKEKLDVYAYPQNPDAKVNITGNTDLHDGENIINIEVISKNGLAKRNYYVKIDKSKDLNISDTYIINTPKKNNLAKIIIIICLVAIILFLLIVIRNIRKRLL